MTPYWVRQARPVLLTAAAITSEIGTLETLEGQLRDLRLMFQMLRLRVMPYWVRQARAGREDAMPIALRLKSALCLETLEGQALGDSRVMSLQQRHVTAYWVRQARAGEGYAAITSEIGTLETLEGQAQGLETDVSDAQIARDGFFGDGGAGYADAAATHHF